MGINKLYMALGEEANRGQKEITTVGFIPLSSPSIPAMEFDEKNVDEFRGDETQKGIKNKKRFTKKWETSLEVPFFTEAGSTPSMIGKILKHFFGNVTTNQQGATSAYSHMYSPVTNPFDSANLDTKALTLNLNLNEGNTMKNWPFVGGRVKSLNFEQEASSNLKLTADFFGQFRDTVTAEIGLPSFADENKRCDYANLKVYTGTINRTGTSPDYTSFDFTSATEIKPEKISVKINNSFEDTQRLNGLDYSDKTKTGRYSLEFEMAIDWEDPTSGFSSVSEFNGWANSISETNITLCWDTGIEAGTGHNHMLIIDMPRLVRMGGDIEYDLEKEPVVNLKYEALVDDTTGYLGGMLLQNTVVSI